MLWTDGSMYEGEWCKGIQHGLGRMIFPDSSVKEGYFENNVFKYSITGNPGVNSVSSIRGANSAVLNQMRSTNASSGFQSDALNNLNQNPYQLNQLGIAAAHKSFNSNPPNKMNKITTLSNNYLSNQPESKS